MFMEKQGGILLPDLAMSVVITWREGPELRVDGQGCVCVKQGPQASSSHTYDDCWAKTRQAKGILMVVGCSSGGLC